MKIIRPVDITSEVSYTRLSVASYIDEDGTLKFANVNQIRIDYDPVTNEMKGPLIEGASENYILNNFSVTDSVLSLSQSLTDAGTFTLSFYGTGTVSITGAATETAIGTGVFPSRKTLTFTKSAGAMTLTVTGTITYVQLESGIKATSFIPNDGVTYTSGIRAADNLTGNGLVYSNVIEDDYADWDGTTSYTVGQRVMRRSIHKVYQNLIPGANATLPENDTSNRWVEVGPTKKWAPFDQSLSTQSSKIDELVYIIKPGRVSGIALLGMSATEVQIAMVANGETVYAGSADLTNGTTVGDWYEYFFEPVYMKDTLVITDLIDASLLNLPQYADCLISVKIKYPTFEAKCSAIIVGLVADLGLTQYDSTVGIVDYSKADADDFGRVSLVKRTYSKRANVNLIVENSQVDNVAKVLSTYRATPLVWVGTDNLYQSLILYGFYRDWEVVLSNPSFSNCNLQIEGLSQ